MVTKMESKEFRKLLVNMVKSAGQELIDRAEDLVGDGDLITDFDIFVHFPLDGRMLYGAPTIEVTRSHISKMSLDAIVKFDEEIQNGKT